MIPDQGSTVSLTDMVAIDRERQRCQGRVAPVGLGLDSADADDSLHQVRKAKPAQIA